MMLEIVMFNMSNYAEWEKGVVNRNYHVLHKLLEHPFVGRIIAIDFLPFGYKRAIRNYWENIMRGSRGTVLYRDLTTKCTKINGYSAELYIFSTIDSIFSHKLVIKKINKVLGEISPGRSDMVSVVWSYFPMFVNYFDGIKSDLTVFDAVDNWIEHPSLVKFKNVLHKNYQTIADKSNLIFTVAEPLIDFFKTLGREKNIHWIPNGIDSDHFISTAGSDPVVAVVNDPIVNIPKPIVGYVGTIQNRVDFDLIEYIARRNSNKSFVFIGPVWKGAEISRLKKFKNIYFLGRKPYTLVPAYIKQFDVCIIPHKLDTFIKYTYSLKMLDYLISGKPVVSTATPDVQIFSEYMYIAKDYKDFSNAIDLSMKSDTIEMRKKRIERAKKEDWILKTDTMMKIINKYLGSRVIG